MINSYIKNVQWYHICFIRVLRIISVLFLFNREFLFKAVVHGTASRKIPLARCFFIRRNNSRIPTHSSFSQLTDFMKAITKRFAQRQGLKTVNPSYSIFEENEEWERERMKMRACKKEGGRGRRKREKICDICWTSSPYAVALATNSNCYLIWENLL